MFCLIVMFVLLAGFAATSGTPASVFFVGLMATAPFLCYFIQNSWYKMNKKEDFPHK